MNEASLFCSEPNRSAQKLLKKWMGKPQSPMAVWESLGRKDWEFLSEDKMTKKKPLLLEMDFGLENSRISLNIENFKALRASRLCMYVHVLGWKEERIQNEELLLCFLQRRANEYTCTGSTSKGGRDQQSWAATTKSQRKEAQPKSSSVLSHH